MKTKIKNFSPIIVIFLFIQLFISCQKNNELSGSSMNANSVDNSINTLPVDSSLVAWYPFHHGQLVDKSGFSNRIVFCSATPVVSKSGQDSGAYYFDGTSSYMMVKNNSSLNPVQSITLAVLLKPMGFYQGKCHANRVLFKGTTDYDNGIISLGFDDLRYYNYDGCDKPIKEKRENFNASYGDGASRNGIDDTSNIKPDKWYYVVYTFNGSVSNLYVNNKLKSTVLKISAFTPKNSNLYIGRMENSTFPYYFNGVIDEIRIYNRALSSAEVLGLDKVMGKD